MDSSCPVGSPCSRTTNEGSDSPAGRIPATLRPTRRLPPSRETPPQPRASSPRSRGSTAAASASTASARAAGSSRRPPRVGDVVSWALIESGPTVTQGESDAFANFAASLPIAEAERAAHAQGPSGYDRAPSIRKLAIPVLWLYAGRDRAQPTGTSMEILRTLSAGHDFTTALFADAPHPLFDENGFPPYLFSRATEWLRQ